MKSFVLGKAWAFCLAIAGTSLALNHLRIDTTSGSVYGMINGSHPDVAQFLGIPFAAPPVGDLRFAPPTTFPPQAIVDATRQGPLCPQYLLNKSDSPSVYTYDTPWLQPAGPIDEDCLTLEIGVPVSNGAANESLPVLIWLFGGGFYEGGTRTLGMDASPWIQRTKSHIVVAINYRNNIFGFPNAQALADNGTNLNFGLMDQRFAVEWLRDNVAAFGGDPNKMYLWGQSSGAASADFYNYAYPKDPIVKGFIMESGSVFATGRFVDFSHSNFTFVAQHVGCGNMSAVDELSCMRSVSWESLINFYFTYNQKHSTGQLKFTTLPDNTTKFNDYEERALAGNFSRLPAILGNNQNEEASLIAWPGAQGPNMTEIWESTLSTHLCTCNHAVDLRSDLSVPTFRYYNTANFSNISPRPWEGAYHTSELPLIFGTYAEYNLDVARPTALEHATSAHWQDLYLAFMRDPMNGLPSMGWPRYATNGSFMMMGGNGSESVGSLIPAGYMEGLCVGVEESYD